MAEIRVIDVQAEDSRGRRVRDPVLHFADQQGWTVQGWVASASPLHPSLQRLRSDKVANAQDCGWDQLADQLPAEDEDPDLKPEALRVLRRSVWTKAAGDSLAVRKLVVWATGRADFGFAPFVVHWTDFSAGRKAPLAREVRLAPSEELAMKIAEQMIDKGVKKGWELVE